MLKRLRSPYLPLDDQSEREGREGGKEGKGGKEGEEKRQYWLVGLEMES